jgi:chromosomal replication initiator protein
MYMLEKNGFRIVEIGQLLGGRDHSTIIYGIRKVEQALSSDQTFAHLLKDLSDKLCF